MKQAFDKSSSSLSASHSRAERTTSTISTGRRSSERRTHFHPSVKIYPVPNRPYDEQIQRLWMTRDDQKSTQEDIFVDVLAMRRLLREGCSIPSIFSGLDDDYNKYCRADSLRGDDVCFRGLEHMTSRESHQKKKSRQKLVVKMVLDEQRRQIDTGEYDARVIADISSFASTFSRHQALRLARNDAIYVHSERSSSNINEEPLQPKQSASTESVESQSAGDDLLEPFPTESYDDTQEEVGISSERLSPMTPSGRADIGSVISGIFGKPTEAAPTTTQQYVQQQHNAIELDVMYNGKVAKSA